MHSQPAAVDPSETESQNKPFPFWFAFLGCFIIAMRKQLRQESMTRQRGRAVEMQNESQELLYGGVKTKQWSRRHCFPGIERWLSRRWRVHGITPLVIGYVMCLVLTNQKKQRWHCPLSCFYHRRKISVVCNTWCRGHCEIHIECARKTEHFPLCSPRPSLTQQAWEDSHYRLPVVVSPKLKWCAVLKA